ncbi:MAG: Gfo/Idh/MocA family oxidoreductase [Proteobacteria bacterium]|nr:Gfo/Idh/MocA family oxidoreductase [Pseudomonadota bacterium]
MASEGAVITAVCDIDSEKARQAGEQFGAKWFTDAAEMIKKTSPELVDIVTQPGTHRELVELTAQHNIATMVQKPLALTWSDCCAIGDNVTKAGIFFGVHENFRFQAPMLRLKQLIRNGVIGEISFARISFRTGFDVFAAQPYLRNETRLVIQDVGIHVLDLARFFLGEVDHLTCETQKRLPDIAGEDTATMMLRHKSSAVSVVDASFSAHCLPDAFPETLIEIEGSKGLVRLNPGGQIEVVSGGLNWQEDASTPLLDWTERPWHVTQHSVLLLNRHVLQAYKASRQPDTEIIGSLKTHALVNAAYEAAETGRAVIPETWHPKVKQ